MYITAHNYCCYKCIGYVCCGLSSIIGLAPIALIPIGISEYTNKNSTSREKNNGIIFFSMSGVCLVIALLCFLMYIKIMNDLDKFNYQEKLRRNREYHEHQRQLSEYRLRRNNLILLGLYGPGPLEELLRFHGYIKTPSHTPPVSINLQQPELSAGQQTAVPVPLDPYS